MNKLTGIVVAIVLAVVLWGLLKPQPPAVARVDTVVVRESVISRAVAETTRLVTTRLKVRVDTLPGTVDTVKVPVEVIREVIRQCDVCAARLERQTAFSDSVIKSRDDSIAKLNRALATERKRRSWWALGGLLAGVAVTR